MAEKYNQTAWRYQLDEAFEYRTELLAGVVFSNRWVSIIDGVVTVNKDYAWDGCSPAWYVPFLGWIGVPDGCINMDGLPQAYYASLVHDALCQFRSQVPIDKATALAVFKQLLLEGGFPKFLASVYVWAVDWFGPQDWRGFPPVVNSAA